MLSYIWHHYIIFICLLYVQSECLTFNVQNSLNSQWTFKEGSTVTLVCTIRPYYGILTFVFNSTTVYGCTGSQCTTIGYGRENFSFQSDTDNGVFTWTILKMGIEFNGGQFECSDGINNTMLIATVKGVSVSSSHIILVIVIPSVVVPVTVLVLTCVMLFSNQYKRYKCCKSCKCAAGYAYMYSSGKTQIFRKNSHQNNQSSLDTYATSAAMATTDV